MTQEHFETHDSTLAAFFVKLKLVFHYLCSVVMVGIFHR